MTQNKSITMLYHILAQGPKLRRTALVFVKMIFKNSIVKGKRL